MNNKERAKEELIKLVTDFKNNPDYYKKLSEADVEDKLVNELFVNILGWDKKDYEKRVKARRGNKSGSADYAFKINDRIIFFLEVKKVTIPLDKEADEQVILYSLSKKVPLAISTNFQQMNIFCVEQENAVKNVFRTFKNPEDYVTNFSDFLFLSKESFEQGLLLKKAEDEGRLKKRVSIDKVLLEDFWRVRTLIADDIEKNKSGKYTLNEKDEIVQRILDRLIFIRRCEDMGINPENQTLEEIKHIAESRAYSQLKALFSKYDFIYNSGLFTQNKDNDCDKITINGEIIQKLIGYLYESHDGKYKYNFEWIDADVLGQVYEQYLGKILAQTKSGKAKLKEGQAHRKEQGIYYTPTYVVDYIVKNTLGELLKDKKIDARKIKILDPACGSGSFLIKAFDYLNDHLSSSDEAKQYKLDSQGAYSIKTEILKNNIFGVDLDNKAVEITKLNLLLKAAERFRKLPSELDNHVGWGNSLIDDDTFEHPFKWVGDFQEGTFDVVIGNPPYGADLKDAERKFLLNNYPATKNNTDTAIGFINKSFNLLKKNGYLGLIVPKPLIYSQKWIACRKFIQKDLISIVDVSKAFEDVLLEQVIIIIKNNSNYKKYLIDFIDKKQEIVKVEKSLIDKFGNLINDVSENELNLAIKLNKNRYVSDVVTIYRGLIIQKFLKQKGEVPVLRGKSIGKYLIKEIKEFVTKEDYKKIEKEADYLLKPKIVIQNIVAHVTKPKDHIILMSGIDEKGLLALDNVGCVFLKDKDTDKLFIVALLNSTLMSWYAYRFIYAKAIRTMRLDKYHISKMPLCNYCGKIEYNKILPLANKMLSLNKQLQEIGDKKTSQTAKLEAEIKQTDQEIDDLVYKLYGITETEKRIIEDSLK